MSETDDPTHAQSSPPRAARPEYDVVLTVRNPQRPGMIGRMLSLVGDHGALVGDIETRYIGRDHIVRDLTLSVFDEPHLEEVLTTIRGETDSVVINVRDLVFDRHTGGKIRTGSTTTVERLEDLRYIYTPGVARVCTAIQEDPGLARRYTAIGHTVGIFTNGTRVLGLGDIGALASLPVMEGKAVLYDRFVGLSAVPIVIDEKDPEAFVETVVRVAPSFGGIHLEDIRTPDCFWIEEELIRRLPQPVMHDDQHGTATVLLAAVLSALRHTGREGQRDLTCVQVGLGAAGLAIAQLLMDAGFNVIGVDPGDKARARLERHGGRTAELHEAAAQADVLIATTGVVGLITQEMVQPGQIVLALSNPIPEITPEAALDAGAAFAADGRSVNNALAFPGIFKAALEVGAPAITSAMKIAAASAISAFAPDDELVPSPFHPEVHAHVIDAVRKAV
ncbi:MAG: NAD(P)-dependent oxidoreductase [Rubricoccaceae bacterium]